MLTREEKIEKDYLKRSDERNEKLAEDLLKAEKMIDDGILEGYYFAWLATSEIDDEMSIIRYLILGAKAGDPKCIFQLAIENTDHDEVELRELVFPQIKQLAESNDPHAQYMYANYFQEGEVVERDDDQAAYWMLKAAEQGVEGAQLFLATFYEDGIGLEQDYEKAAYWYQKAADVFVVKAMTKLSIMYVLGQGVEINYDKAFELAYLAAKSDDPLPLGLLGECYRFGYGVKKNAAEAIRLYKLSAKAGFCGAQYFVGYWLLTGDHMPQNVKQGIQMLKKAARGGNDAACFRLGEYYADIDPKMSFRWFLRAARLGDGNSQLMVARCYNCGIGVGEDANKYKYWLKKASENDNFFDIDGDCFDEENPQA